MGARERARSPRGAESGGGPVAHAGGVEEGGGGPVAHGGGVGTAGPGIGASCLTAPAPPAPAEHPAGAAHPGRGRLRPERRPDDGRMPDDEPLSGRAYLRLVGLGAVIGIPAAVLAALFLAFVHEAEGWLWDDLPDALDRSSPPWFLVVGLPVVGAAVVAVARRFLPGDGGHRPLDGIRGGPTPVSHVPGVVLAAVGSLAFGAVVGPEAPVIAVGSAVGMAGTRLSRRLGEQGTAVVAQAGAFSAVSALFGGPRWQASSWSRGPRRSARR